jgi:endonuclease/exonuclease/phosphatase family metal-dependent hydrolase
MRFVSFNVQFGVGLDGVCDPKRVADAVRGADIIALQEVSRNLPKNSHADLPAIFAALLPDYFTAFGSGVDADMGSEIIDGKAASRRLHFGNMVLSRYPILTVRNILLPRTRTFGLLNLQRSAVETLIGSPSGPIRIYSVHLDHTGPAERILQIEYLKQRASLYGVEGGGISGYSDFGFPDPPHTDDYLIMGDFNMLPESPEYIAMAGPKDHYYVRTPRTTCPTDALDYLGKRGPGAYTWEEPSRTEDRQYLDYCFVSGTLVSRLKDGWVDEECVASDHKPVWVEIE